MSVSNLHILSQGPVIAGLLKVGVAAITQRPAPGGTPPETPGPDHTATVGPRSPRLLADAVRWSGGNPRAWKGVVPPYLFPQWGFPLMGQTLTGIPYPLAKVLNQGCHFEVRAPLPAGEPLQLSARLEAVEASPHKARIHQRLVTGTPSVPEALVADVYSVVPLGRRPGGGRRRARPSVPESARLLARVRLGADAGLDFARLTGDFNPVHWVGPYARAAGFRSCILHGFATLAIAVERTIQTRWSGDVSRLAAVDVRFVRPLVLPATVGVFLASTDDPLVSRVAVGVAPGGPAFMLGTVTARAWES